MDYRAPFELVDRLLTKKYSFKRISFEETWIVMPAAGWEDGKIIPLKPEEKTVPLRTEEEVNTDPEHVACYWLDDPEVFKKYTDMSQPNALLLSRLLVVVGLNEKRDETVEIYSGWGREFELANDLTRIGESSCFDEFHSKERVSAKSTGTK